MNYNDIIKYIDDNNDKQINILYEELKNIVDINLLDFIFYDKFKYEYTKIIEKDETMEQREKRLDTEFRKTIRNKYTRCMITGKPLCVSQVAHIYPHNLCKPEEKYDPDNGFLLCAELHILFDSKDCDFKIDPETHLVTFSKNILEDITMSYYTQYHNKKIILNDRQKYYLKKKYDLFIK